ncbi:hypothetical protein, partial [Streptomyces cacaoi]
ENLLSGISEEHLLGMGGVYANNLRIAPDFHPVPFHGDVLHIRARPHEDHPALEPRLWDPYVTGELRVHDSRHQHNDLGSAASLAEIAALLADGAHPEGEGS